ncbi:SH3 domain-containing protein [Rhizobium rhizosphaerae]|uniref:SH3 domain-containing protein n=1 Tax=Xaviernesmea rhizosphaerae TaxID=1672749 RepID=UPI001FD948E2|nr:SH3 domain-containing protein [Xaviernesmea rhizosphaerae]
MFNSAFKFSAAAGAAFLAVGLFPSLAAAASGYSTANVNMRSGPSTRYPAVTVIPAGASVEIHGCLAEVPWCDVSFRYGRGWVAGRYLQTIYRERRVYLAPEYYRPLGIPTVTFDVDTYWTRNYRSRDFYRERDYWREWRGGWRDDRPLPPRPRWEPDRPRWEADRPRWEQDRPRREPDRQNWERDRQQNWERDRENRERDRMNRERDRENRELDQRNRDLDRQNRERDRQNFERDNRQREWDNHQRDRDQRGGDQRERDYRGEREMRDRDRQNWEGNPERDGADRARIRRPENGACMPGDPACAR